MVKINTVSCPTCHKKHDWKKSKPWSPFCCQQCKLIDLGEWAGEKHRIAGEPVKQHYIEEADSEIS
jgi:uncharacterized protein